MAVYGPMIEHEVAVAANNKEINGSYFQVLGFDILPDENLDCYLLEINDHPSLDIYLEKDYMGGGTAKSISKIDLYVKQRVLTDAIMLAKKSKTKIAETETFGSLERVVPI